MFTFFFWEVGSWIAIGDGGTRAGAGRAIGQSGDGGIDDIIDEDRLGLDAIYYSS